MKIELKSRSLLERVPLAKVPDVVFGCQMVVFLWNTRKAKVFCLSKISGFVSHTCVLVHCPHLRWFWMWHSRHPSCSRSSADVIFVSFDSDGAGTWCVRKEVVDYLTLEMVLANRERRHGVSIIYLSTGLQMCASFWRRHEIWYSRNSMRSHWRVVSMRWRPVRRCMCDSYDAKRCPEPLESITNSYQWNVVIITDVCLLFMSLYSWNQYQGRSLAFQSGHLRDFVRLQNHQPMDGFQVVGDSLCDIGDFGRIHLATAIFSHELDPTH